MDPQLLYARLPRAHRGFVLSFDGSAKTEKHGGYGSCAWILWKLPEWNIVIAASAFLETTTVNLAEYTGMNNGVSAALEHRAEDLVIAGDSRFAIQQSLGVIASRQRVKEQLEKNKIKAKLAASITALIRPQSGIPIVTMSINSFLGNKTHFNLGKAL
ncbi:hypothetical protein ON010_g18851 [Phytophthora cinnamomi]|nr:hypothetical protein ON010_g18851 [Phytophthora cinnamomi]